MGSPPAVEAGSVTQNQDVPTKSESIKGDDLGSSGSGVTLERRKHRQEREEVDEPKNISVSSTIPFIDRVPANQDSEQPVMAERIEVQAEKATESEPLTEYERLMQELDAKLVALVREGLKIKVTVDGK